MLTVFDELRSSTQGKMTHQEANFLQRCRTRAAREFEVAALVTYGVVWKASGKLSKLLRLTLAGGAALGFGVWRLDRKLYSCVDYILSQDGSRMQREAANIILQRHRDDPWKMQLIYKYFYSEKIFDDSTSDEPKFRWRHRNFFSDHVAENQKAEDSDFHSDLRSDSHDGYHRGLRGKLPSDYYGDLHNNSVDGKRDSEFEQVLVHPGVAGTSDPLDIVFGYGASGMEVHNNVTSSLSARGRSHKRTRHKRKRHHSKASNS